MIKFIQRLPNTILLIIVGGFYKCGIRDFEYLENKMYYFR